MIRNKSAFNLLYYSHSFLILPAMVISTTINVVLTQQITWGAIILLGLSTFLTYSIDNLIDWKKDQANYQDEAALIKKYHRVTYFLIVLSLLGILWIIFSTNTILLVSLTLLGSAVIMTTARFLAYRKLDRRNPETFSGFVLNRLFISLVWSIVCVFLPLWYAGTALDNKAWSALIYIFPLIFIYAVLWKLEKTDTVLREEILASPVWLILKVLSIWVALWSLSSTLMGRFPLTNLFNLLSPGVIFILLCKWPHSWENARKHITWFTFWLVLTCLISLIGHLIFS
ncbi:MAG: hypothetical protein MUO40_05865 [Anaerolineaceae bacterium]|nr:hypothetical protein [Anaerolineaceae bacterium]